MPQKLTIGLALLAGAAVAPAQYLVDQGPSMGTYSGGYSDITGGQVFADTFTLGQSSVATGYNFFGVLSSEPATYTLNLYADSGSNTPGATLLTMSNLVPTTFGEYGLQNNATLYEAQFTGLDISLAANTKYWISISGNGSDAGVAVETLNSGTGHSEYQSSPSSGWNNYSPNAMTYQLVGAPAPEPVSMLALGLGVAALARKRARR